MEYYSELIPLGYYDSDEQIYLYNHLHFRVETEPSDTGFNIVGFAVEPMSINHEQMAKSEQLLENKIHGQ